MYRIEFNFWSQIYCTFRRLLDDMGQCTSASLLFNADRGKMIILILCSSLFLLLFIHQDSAELAKFFGKYFQKQIAIMIVQSQKIRLIYRVFRWFRAHNRHKFKQTPLVYLTCSLRWWVWSRVQLYWGIVHVKNELFQFIFILVDEVFDCFTVVFKLLLRYEVVKKFA